MPSLQETLKRYQEAGLEETLKDQSILVEEEGLLTVAGSRLEPIRDQLDNLRGEMPIDLTFLSSDALSDLPEATLLAEAGQVLEVFGRDVEQWLLAGEKMLADAGARLMSLQGKLGERAEGIRRDYEKKLRYLHKSRVNGEEFIRLREQLEALRPVQERSKLLHRQLQEQEKRRHSLLIEWEELLGEEFRSYERAARKVSRALQGRVRVHVQAHGDREPLYKALREGLGGRLSESVEALGRCDLLSPSSIVRMFREGKDVLRDRLEIPESQARRLAQADAEVLMRMEELDLPTITRIELNVAGQGGSSEQWQPLDQLSTGQKATAVLLLLLLESDGPLVIDQPEDDLDNRFVTEEVIPRMREAKHRRQFIFSTHNANIPVLGDAELILGLTSSAEGGSGRTRIAPEHAGSIDARPVMELVERLLEGGQDAFERRRRKYGF